MEGFSLQVHPIDNGQQSASLTQESKPLLEKEIIERCQSGDEEAFRAIFDRYQRKIFGLCYHFTGNGSDAEELTQEIFLKTYLSIGQFDFRSSFYTWLFRITVNECLQHRRKKRPRRVPLEERTFSLSPSESLPLDSVLSHEKQEQVRQALKKLPGRYRLVLLFKEIDGLSYGEMARIFGVSEGTIASRLNRARERFRKAYEKEVSES
ncbi:sigma-70 family RNA polymerase sigma factor [Acidobacteria bacterium AH-259-L09]|nr:sigma-70 family RNA polymerase sigma factor [Acidobacteria bacterium AH-259-L09]